MATNLPDKLYYKIGEVAEVAQVKTSVLRFWETEFAFLNPEKSTTGQRLYSKKEVELVLHVRRLLYDEKYTIEGVKKKISPKGKFDSVEVFKAQGSNCDLSNVLSEIRRDLRELRNML